MSAENVEKARSYIEAYNRRDFDAATRWFHPHVEWVLPERQSFDSGRGPEAVLRFWRGLDETFDELRLVPQEYVDRGDRVATRLRHFARGKGSGLALEEELYHQVVTFREGLMVRIEYFGSWPEALDAAGRGGPLSYEKDRRVDEYIDALPEWQQRVCQEVRDLVHEADPEVEETIKRRVQPYFVLEGNICALLAAKDHVNVFLYDGAIVPDPEGVITGGHDNKTARTVAIREGEQINRGALKRMFEQIAANNRAGGWRKLKAQG